MRLFIAVNFTLEVKNKLENVIEKLKSGAQKGNFTLKDNLHLTLAFIGETERISELKQCMDRVDERAFEIVLKDIGAFTRGPGRLCWMGVNKTMELDSVYNQLKTALQGLNFPVENREFKPHLTLAREAVLKQGWDLFELSKGIEPIKVQVDKISLMKSERINGKMKYTEIYFKELNK